MSSMDVKSLLPKSLLPKSLLLRAASVSLLAPILAAATACHASDGSEWDRARAALIAGQRSSIAQAVDKWQALSASRSFGFSEYAGFLLAYPGFPEEEKLRRAAEAALDREGADPARLVAYFDRFPPLTNPARAQYALALRAMGRGESAALANQAWRGGAMSDSAETAIASTFGNSFTPADQDARMDALLWAGAQAQAERQLGLTSPSYRGIAAARLAVLAGSDPLATGIPVDMAALNADPGYIYARARQLRRQGQASAAAELLANRPRLSRKPLDREGWVTEMLANARAAVTSGNARAAVRIAAKIDDAFDPGEDIARLSFPIRDNSPRLPGSAAARHCANLAARPMQAACFTVTVPLRARRARARRASTGPAERSRKPAAAPRRKPNSPPRRAMPISFMASFRLNGWANRSRRSHPNRSRSPRPKTARASHRNR